MRKFLFLIPLFLLLTFCSLPMQPAQDISAIVNATLTAIAEGGQAPAVGQAAPVSGAGSISGQLQYPADAMPPLKIFAFLVGSDQFYSVETTAGQMDYRIDNLPEGKYHVIAYTVGGNGFPGGLSGAYTQAVLCGMGADCADHTLVDVVVFSGETTTDVNVFDWLQPGLPPMPGAPAAGGISGALAYPGEAIPPLKVVAFNLDTGANFSLNTAADQKSYQLDNLPVGRYNIVAYALNPDGTSTGVVGGYSNAVPCGLTVNCTDHTLIEVVVVGGSIVPNISPFDFYAPEGTFPAMP